ncbi:MAG: hypothetical protein ACFBQW_01930 [Sphingomonadaceae bacterium]
MLIKSGVSPLSVGMLAAALSLQSCAGRGDAMAAPDNAAASEGMSLDSAPDQASPCRQAKTAEEFDRYGVRTGPGQCIEFRRDGLVYATRAHLSKWGALPYISISREASVGPDRDIAMLIVGGPGGWIWDQMNDPLTKLFELFLEEFDAVFVPGYYGTSHRGLWPDPNLANAVPELLAFADWIESDPRNRISYVSFSAGGLILNEIFVRRKEKMLLINPPLLSTEELYEQRGESYEQKKVGMITGESGRDFLGYPVIRFMLDSEYYPAFFGKYYKGSLIDAETGSWEDLDRCTVVLVGTKDERIGRQTALRRWPNLPVEPLEGVDHYVDEEFERRKLAEKIRTWKQQDCKAAS